MRNKNNSIIKATTQNEHRECFSFFQQMWQNEFNLIIGEEKFQSFFDSEIFFIKDKNILIGCVQINIIDNNRQYEINPSLKGVAKIGEKILWRIGVIEEYRGQKIGSQLIEFVIMYYKNQGDKNIFLPSAIQNLGYYERFGFHGISEPKNLGNTQVVMMRKKLVNELVNK